MADIYDSTGNVISKSYDIAGNLLTMCYDYQGNPLRKAHAVSKNVTRSLLMSPGVPTGTQGFACDNITKTIAQLSSGLIWMIDIDSENFTQTNGINLGHGNTGQFAPTKTSNQDYPLLYVSGAGYRVNDEPYIFLLEIICTPTTATLKKIYAIPTVSGRGGTLQTCIDFENNIVYVVSATTYSGTADYMYITAWDMNASEVLSGATYSPTPQDGIYALTEELFEFSIPFVPEMQSCTFFDGLVVLLSDRSGEANKYIQFVDVEFKDVYLTLNKQMLGGELEGVGFLYNDETEKYDMIVSHRVVSSGETEYHTEYWRYEFH